MFRWFTIVDITAVALAVLSVRQKVFRKRNRWLWEPPPKKARCTKGLYGVPLCDKSLGIDWESIVHSGVERGELYEITLIFLYHFAIYIDRFIILIGACW
jgi:hypothetical protein